MLSQHDDPIVKFSVPLAVQKPDWLGPERPPGVPKELVWRPFATFLTTMIDAKNAMSVVPGTFVSRGHDYRGQLAVSFATSSGSRTRRTAWSPWSGPCAPASSPGRPAG